MTVIRARLDMQTPNSGILLVEGEHQARVGRDEDGYFVDSDYSDSDVPFCITGFRTRLAAVKAAVKRFGLTGKVKLEIDEEWRWAPRVID
ncbi:hypothetical protein E6W39_18890 [Kitasatospora acidiphila]|uniref:Uncharacterized protein n=1 Tax=Kitasatospora acidiphila TaxID=2567942 RepID=A0A540W4I8_9ACTN|nr:hypothetical protein [Kitasatospora acidiphila]TQF03920.1 hypothetical protein E6W39_18890 [Kitasatospora acidiphila]